MTRRSQQIRVKVLLAVLFLAEVLGAQACNVPVFRYALERWPASIYDAILFHRGPLGPDHLPRLELLKRSVVEQNANVAIKTVDLDAAHGLEEQIIWRGQSNAPLPWLVLRAHDSEPHEASLDAGKLSDVNIAGWLDSPARRELAERILRGDSVVWVLIETADAKKNEDVAVLLTNELRKLETTLKLAPPAADDPPPRSLLPLRIAFSIQRLALNAAGEESFLRMLLHGDKVDVNEPIVVPVFGRGRVLAAFSGKEISAKLLHQASAFLCGACSCEVKEMNPGRDLLMAVNWEKLFTTPPPAAVVPEIKPGEKVPIAPGTAAVAASKATPNPERGMKLLSGATLAFIAVLGLIMGIAVLHGIRKR